MIRCMTLSLALLLPAGAFAQMSGASGAAGMDHGAHMAGLSATAAQVREPGQAAFAAIHEIVSLLEADASTDWSKVDVPALHRHLIDMSNVTLFAHATSEPVAGGARFTVRGTNAVRDSIRRMVYGHAATMNGVGGWRFAAKEHPDGVVLTVTAAGTEEIVKLRALGFIGVMTRGMHHQTHHLMIATGRGPHE